MFNFRYAAASQNKAGGNDPPADFSLRKDC
jgi:hypothetical protein